MNSPDRDFDVTCITIISLLTFLLLMTFVIQKSQPDDLLERCLIAASQGEEFNTAVFRACVK